MNFYTYGGLNLRRGLASLPPDYHGIIICLNPHKLNFGMHIGIFYLKRA